MKHASVWMQREGKGWFAFEHPVRVLQARRAPDVCRVLDAVHGAVQQGHFAAGFITYEAAPGLDSALRTCRRGHLPLIWFGVYGKPRLVRELPDCDAEFRLGKWMPAETVARFRRSVDRIRGLIRAGDTYQVNYTFRLHARFFGSPFGLFRALCRAQAARYCSFVETDDFAICSASPELFFQIDGSRIVARPMKGTWARGLTLEEDRQNSAALAGSMKNRAENVMIVDMVRNDLGRVARPGSVKVSNVFQVERYPTVFQMVSTVRAETHASFPEIIRALFPCASITGAPKVRTMEVIKELERRPRGIYTGAMGYLSPGSLRPGKNARRALFNVAIRTVEIRKKTRRAEYGVGGGVVWDSNAAGEYRECMTKARILSTCMPEFSLLETIRWDVSRGYFLLEPHLGRLEKSAEYFDFAYPAKRISSALQKAATAFSERTHRVRLMLGRRGRIRVEAVPIERQPGRNILRVAVDDRPVDSSNPFLYHKTTNRRIYEDSAARHPGFDDVILFNERGELTESCRSNLVVQLRGKRYTPPVSCGLLPGIYRGFLLGRRKIAERILLPHDLKHADSIWLINSVREWIPVMRPANGPIGGPLRR